MDRIITEIPGTSYRVVTRRCESFDGMTEYCIEAQQEAEGTICFPWEIDGEGYRTMVYQTAQTLSEAEKIHNQLASKNW